MIKWLTISLFIVGSFSHLYGQTTNTSVTNAELTNSGFIDDYYNINVLYNTKFVQKKDQIIQLYSEKKDPLTAGLLSLLYAGAGQFYMKEFTKGSLLFLGESVYYLFFYAMRLKFQNTYGITTSFKSLNPSDKVLIISSFAVYMALKFYSIYDAYDSAVEHNRAIDETLDKLYLNISPEEFSLSFNLRF